MEASFCEVLLWKQNGQSINSYSPLAGCQFPEPPLSRGFMSRLNMPVESGIVVKLQLGMKIRSKTLPIAMGDCQEK
jgi:hypothetical protein